MVLLKPISKMGVCLRRGLSMACVLLMAASIAFEFPLITRKLLHEDAELFASAARLLVSTGSLLDYGHFLPLQLLRESGLSQPFYFGSLSTVFTYAPFFGIFGANDVTYYFVQSLLWLAIFWVMSRKLGSFFHGFLVFALGSALGTWHRSVFTASTGLPVIVIFLAVWPFHKTKGFIERPIVTGLALGLGCTYRWEALIVLGVIIVNCLMKKARIPALRLVVSSVSVIVLHGLLKRALGVGSDSDYAFFNVGSSIFADGLSTVGLPESIPLSEIFTNLEYRAAACRKILKTLISVITLRSSLFSRGDAFLIGVALVGVCTGLLRWRGYVPVLILLLGYVVQAFMVLDFARYFDPVFSVLLFQLWLDLYPKVRAAIQHPGFALVLVSCFFGIHDAFAWKAREIDVYNRNYFHRAIEKVRTIVPSGSLLISDQPYLWIWYLHEKYGAQLPLENARTLDRVLKKFPSSYLVLFLGDSRSRGAIQSYVESNMIRLESEPAIYRRPR
jgi:hypothetical protein